MGTADFVGVRSRDCSVAACDDAARPKGDSVVYHALLAPAMVRIDFTTKISVTRFSTFFFFFFFFFGGGVLMS